MSIFKVISILKSYVAKSYVVSYMMKNLDGLMMELSLELHGKMFLRIGYVLNVVLVKKILI